MGRLYMLVICMGFATFIAAQHTDDEPEKGWQKVGYKTTKGVIDAIKENVAVPTVTPAAIDSGSYYAGHGFIGGAVDGIKDKHLTPYLDKAVDHYSAVAALNLVKMRDSLLRMNDSSVGYWLLNWAGSLREKLAGEGLTLDTKRLLATILSDDTELRSRKIVRGVIDESLSPVTQKEMTALVNVLGDAVSKQAGKVTDTILNHIDKKITEEKGKFDDELHAYKYGLLALGFLLLMSVAILVFTLYQNYKHARLNEILTYEIHKLDPQHFEHLSEKIQDHTKREGLEAFLRKILHKKGMLGDETRRRPAGSKNNDKT